MRQARRRTSGGTTAGPARVFDCEHGLLRGGAANRQIVAGDVVVIRYEGPDRRPGHAGDARASRARSWARAWASSVALLTDGRFSRRDPRADDRARAPEAAVGGPIALVEEGDIDRRRRRRQGAQPRGRRGDVLAERRARWTPPAPRYTDRRAGQVRGARLVRVRGRDHERRAAAPDASRAAPTATRRAERAGPGDPPDLVQDLAPAGRLGRRSTRRGRSPASCRRLFDGAWMNDHLTDMDPDRARAVARGAHRRSATLAHHVPGPAGRARGAVEHVPPPGAAREGGDGPGPRDRRPVRPRARRRLVRERARAVRDRPAADRRALSTASISARRGDPARCSRPEAAGAAGRDPRRPVLPAPRRDQPARRRSRPGGPPICTSAARSRAGSALAARAAQGWLLPGTEAGDDAYFARSATMIVRALEDAGRDPATFELVGQVSRGGTAAAGARALEQARRDRRPPARRRSCSACRPRSGRRPGRRRTGTCCPPLPRRGRVT